MMDRIVIVGSPGSGKSTLAERLANKTGIQLFHLDNYYWRPGWVEVPTEEWLQIHRGLISGDRWIIDGTYLNTIDERLTRADTVISFHSSRWKCIYRILRRSLLNHGKEIQAPGCPERIDLEFVKYVWDFPKAHQGRLEEAMAKHGATLKIIRIESRRDLELFA